MYAVIRKYIYLQQYQVEVFNSKKDINDGSKIITTIKGNDVDIVEELRGDYRIKVNAEGFTQTIRFIKDYEVWEGNSFAR